MGGCTTGEGEGVAASSEATSAASVPASTDGTGDGEVDGTGLVNDSESSAEEGDSGMDTGLVSTGTTGATGADGGSSGAETSGTTGAPLTCEEARSECTDEAALPVGECMAAIQNEPDTYCIDQIIFHDCNNEYGAAILACNDLYPECSPDGAGLICSMACSDDYIVCLEDSGCSTFSEFTATGCVTSLSECQGAC